MSAVEGSKESAVKAFAPAEGRPAGRARIRSATGFEDDDEGRGRAKKSASMVGRLMGSSHGLGIPEAEFASRVAKVRKFVVARDLGALVVFSASRSSIWYQTGHVGYISNWSNLDRVFDTMVVLPAEGAPVLLIAGLPYVIEKVREVSWMTDVRVVGAEDPRAAALPGLTRTFGTEVRDILRERGGEGKKVGLVGVEAMSVAVYQSLVRALSESAIEFSDDVVADLRCRKSPAEVALMREAARLSDLGFERRPGPV